MLTRVLPNHVMFDYSHSCDEQKSIRYAMCHVIAMEVLRYICQLKNREDEMRN